LDEGLAKFPANANLILSKGYRYETFGEVEKALQTFRAAISVSETNAMTRPEDAESSRDIAAAAAREKSSLERKLSASAASGLTTDEMWLAINAGKCEAVLNALQKKSTSAWSAEDYQLSYAAHAACWSSTGAESHKEGARRSVVDGLKAFPDSAELLSDGAFFEEKLGDRRAAAQYFQRFAAACKARAGRCAPDAQQMIAEHLRSLGATQ
jgi:tetratricopeptide (TPR) repeat protein